MRRTAVLRQCEPGTTWLAVVRLTVLALLAASTQCDAFGAEAFRFDDPFLFTTNDISIVAGDDSVGSISVGSTATAFMIFF